MSHVELRSLLSGITGIIRFDEPMSRYTSFRIGGPADAYVEPADIQSLQQLMMRASAEETPVFVMGGTNLLVRDGGIQGIVVRLVNLDRIEEPEAGMLYAEGGVLMPRLLKWATQRGLTGLEFAAGIPGARAKIDLSVKESLHRRKNTQPIEMPNAGCVFKNPAGDSAGRLIEAAGLKGARIGDAQISTKHANFIVNRGHATAVDTEALIRLVGTTVADKFGTTLELEVQIVGRELV